MSQQSFAGLGVSNAVCTALNERGFTAPFAIQTQGDRRRARRPRRARQVPDRLRQDPRLLVPIVDRIEADRPPSRGAHPRPHARARHPDRRGELPDRPRPRPEGRAPSTAASASRSRPARPAPPTSSSRPRAASRTSSSAATCRSPT